MTKSFTWLALGIAFTLMTVQLVFNDVDRGRELPLLTTLFINEVGSIVSLFGLISSLKRIKTEGFNALMIAGTTLCVMFMITFIWTGYQQWLAL